MNSSPGLRRERQRLYLRILAVSAAIGTAYGAVTTHEPASLLGGIAIGAVNGLAIAACISGAEIFLLRGDSPWKRLLELPFVALVALKTLVYATIVCVFVIGVPRLGAALFGRGPPSSTHGEPEITAVGFSLVVTLIFVVAMQAATLIGRRTFLHLVLGRYRRPRAERRFFLFTDVVGSTAIAERLGPLEAHRFLAAVFRVTAEPVAASAGEIYQYVGDEMVVSWTEAEGIVDARPLRCYLEMRQALADSSSEFRRRFGAEPQLRAALHLGEVIAGEVGEQRRAIVYHGDVMNTTARLEQATRDTGCLFIASNDAIEKLGRPGGLGYRDLGELTLSGRKVPMRAWAIDVMEGPQRETVG